jgi:histidyl-tRNA synthetase
MQVGPVWRAERPQKGRFRQFTQCDIDIIGLADERAEVELIAVTLLALEALNLRNVTVRINDRQLLVKILDACGFPSAAHSTALIVIDKLDKIGTAGVEDELSQRIPDKGDAVKCLVGFLEEVRIRSEQNDNSFETIPPILPFSDDASLVNKLKYIYDNIIVGLPSAVIRFDPTLVRGMGYYTGPIFEIAPEGGGNSIAGGGRYDGMIGRFCDKDVPASGFSLGFERIVELLDEGMQVRRESLAMFFDPDIEPGTVLKNQRILVDLGYEVTPMVRPNRIGKAIQRAANDGFGSFIELINQNQVVVEADIRSTTM